MGDIKVTDRRMFTPDGRVREEFAAEAESAPQAELAPSAPGDPTSTPAREEDVSPAAAQGSALPEAAVESPLESAAGPRLELPGAPAGLGPTFLDLVGLLTDPLPFYLGDETLPDGQSVENLDAARLHIDMLDVLRQRTAGNLTAQEQTVLDDLLYRLRVRYVQKRG
ncbi:MAG: DUF1844 domain-containing protein [Thermoanaerobaculia bacterium]